MKCVIVEDDPHKSKQIEEAVLQIVGNIEIEVCFSYRSGLKSIISQSFGFAILDMSMPTFDVSNVEKGGRTRAYGGRDILDELKRRKINIPVIIVTQFESFGEGEEKKSLNVLREELKQDFGGQFLGAIYYKAALSSWREELKLLICQIEKEGNFDD